MPSYTCFNPRARRGRDPLPKRSPPSVTVSIHAPAGGATFWVQLSVDIEASFNPRARRGRDKKA